MKAVKQIEVRVLTAGIALRMEAMQNDTGRQVRCMITDWQIPAGSTARIWMKKPSEKIVYNNCTIDGNAVLVTLTNQALAEAGKLLCMLEIISGADVVSSFQFVIYVVDSISGNGTESKNESTALEEMFAELAQEAIDTLNEVNQIIANWNGTVETEKESIRTLSAAEQAAMIEISDNIAANYGSINTRMDDLQVHTGYTDNTIVGLQVDYETGTCTRLGGAIGLTAGTDFDKFPMFGNRRRCNLADSGKVNAYYGDATYTEDGSNGQVMVEQPKFYRKVVPLKMDPITDGQGHHLRKANYYVSNKPLDGFTVHPDFRNEAGQIVDYMYFPAFDGSIYDTSASAYLKADEQIADFAVDKLASIANAKPASGKTQNLTRDNAEKLAQNRGKGWHTETAQSISANQLLMMIEYATLNLQPAIGQGVVSVPDTPNTDNNSRVTGGTSSLGNASGTEAGTAGQVSISYRGMENPWGNIWKLVNGVNIWGNGSMKGGVPYICSDFQFAESKNTGNYESAGFTVANANGYISAMGYNAVYDWLFLPSETAGSSSSPVGDYGYVTSNLNGYRIAALGGPWVNGDFAGDFYWSLNSTVGTHVRHYGSRLIYIPQYGDADIHPDNNHDITKLQRTTASAITKNAEGSRITLKDAAEKGYSKLDIQGMTVQDGTPTPDTPTLQNVGTLNEASGKYELKVYSCKNDTDPYDGNTATVTSNRPITKWDRLTIRDGIWGWEYKGNTAIYDGSADEAWYMYSDGTSFALQDNTFALGFQRSMCDKFINVDRAWSTTYDGCYIIYSDHDSLDRKYFRPPNADVTTVEQWRTWLAGHPVTLQYQTVAEEWVPLTHAEQAAMNALCSYPGTTHIWTDDPLQPVITLDYTADTAQYIRDTSPTYKDVGRFAITGEATGTMAACTDSVEWPVLDMAMDGKSKQVTTTRGVQLFNVNILSDAEFGSGYTMFNLSLAPGTYTWSLPKNNFMGSGYCALLTNQADFAGSTDSSHWYLWIGHTTIAGNYQATLTFSVGAGDTTYLAMSGPGSQPTSKAKDLLAKFQIEPGSVPTAWEPYTGGTAGTSPTPDYPQEVQHVGQLEDGRYRTDVVISTQNLLDQDASLKSAGFVKQADGSYYVAKANIPYQKVLWANDAQIHGVITVIASFKHIRYNAMNGVVIEVYCDDGSRQILNTMSTSWTEVRITTPENKTVDRIICTYNTGNAQTWIRDMMITPGAYTGPYTPHRHQSIPIITDRPLTRWDKITCRDGMWGVVYKGGVYTFTGQEDFYPYSLGVLPGFRTSKPDMLPGNYSSDGYCNRFICAKGSTATNGIWFGTQGNNTIYFLVAPASVSTVAEWKAWLQANPTTIAYQLAAEEWVPLSSTEQKALNAAYTYAGLTYAYSTDALQPEITVKYVKDSNAVIQNLLTRITALEAAQTQTAAAFGYLPASVQAEMIENETNNLLQEV